MIQNRFIRNMWYVAAWSTELGAEAPIGRRIIGDPLVLFRNAEGKPIAWEDRCPHRMAPLSAGRLEGQGLRCMYHGLCFDHEGRCVSVPGADRVPPRLTVRQYPVVERSSWLWVWMGDPEKADVELIPDGWGLDNPHWHLKAGALDYDADYELINDNLLDLSHLDYLHEKTLGAATGGRWSEEEPAVEAVSGGVYVMRWLRNARPVYRPAGVDSHTSYYFMLPGIFLQTVKIYPVGTAGRAADDSDYPQPTLIRVDQQAVTPVAPGKARYFFATGVSASHGDAAFAARLYAGLQETFMQDKTMIEAQARVLATTDPQRQMAYIPMDKAPTLFRRMIGERIAAEESAGQPAAAT